MAHDTGSGAPRFQNDAQQPSGTGHKQEHIQEQIQEQIIKH
jgi:hypothetical protein